MAATSTTSTKEPPVSAVNLLSDSKDIYCSLLMLFQHNHDLCTTSGFFPNDVIMEVDSCAIDFRRLGLQTIDVAKVVSSTWLHGTILFYENLSYYNRDEAIEELERIAGQADKLGKIFKAIAAWARNLSGRIHTACIHVKNEIKPFQTKFDQALEDNRLALEKAKNFLDMKQDELDSKEAEEKRWLISLGATAAGYLIFFPLGALGSIITGTGYAIAKKATHDARDAKLDAEQARNEAKRKFDAAKSTDDKAKMIAEVAADLLKSLDGMRIIGNRIGQFWTDESAFFVGQVSDIRANQVFLPQKLLAEKVSSQQIQAWRGAKQSFDGYAAVMSEIMNFFNFSTNAQPVASTKYHIADLYFDLTFPNDLDVSAIMAGGEETKNE